MSHIRLEVPDSTSCEGCAYNTGGEYAPGKRCCLLFAAWSDAPGTPCPACLAARESGTPAERLGVAGVIAAVDAEPEYPENSPTPAEWARVLKMLNDAILEGDSDAVVRALRVSTRLTKEGIRARILDMLEGKP